MSTPIPEALKKPVTNIDEAYAWIRGLIEAELMFHFEDGPEDCIFFKTGEDVFSDTDKKIVRARLDEVYDLPFWGQKLCPIGVANMMEGLDGYRLYDMPEYRLRGEPRADLSIVCYAEKGVTITDCYCRHDDPGIRFEVTEADKVLGNFHLFEDALAFVKGA